MSREFENIWVLKNVQNHYFGGLYELDDNDFIDYHIWQDLNFSDLAKKHLKNVKITRGVNPNIIFHGGCLGCKSQRIYGIDRCKGCFYFRGKTNDELKIDGEDCAKLSEKEFKDIISN
jgi:hypothetical protein